MTAEEAHQKRERYDAASRPSGGDGGDNGSSCAPGAAGSEDVLLSDQELWRGMALNCHATGHLTVEDAERMLKLMVCQSNVCFNQVLGLPFGTL